MPVDHASLRRPLVAGVRGSLALLLALAVVLLAGPPAHAVERVEVVSPSRGGAITGPTDIVVAVDANALQQVDLVQVRMSQAGLPGGTVRGLNQIGGERSGGQSRWATQIDPLRSWAADGQAMANGVYALQAQVTWTGPGGQQQTGWSGHDVMVDAAPPATALQVRVIDAAARSVELTWDRIDLPDFRRYVVQRAAPGGSFGDIAVLATSSTTRFIDAVPEPGAYRYRVVVVRASATGGDRTSTSAERGVEVAPAGEPQPDPSEEPGDDPVPAPGDVPTPGGGEDRPGGSGGSGGSGGTGDGGRDAAPGAGDDGGDAEPGAGDADGRGPLDVRPGSGTVRSGSATVPRVRTGSDAPDVADVAPPAVSGPDDDGFSETLPFGDVDREVVLERIEGEQASPLRRGVDAGDGTLSIYDREIALEQVLPPLAGGLLLFVSAGHVLRLRRD
jgi:hypothetical protein